eukprot:8689242-Pyramimonas_sp.AAC.1
MTWAVEVAPVEVEKAKKRLAEPAAQPSFSAGDSGERRDRKDRRAAPPATAKGTQHPEGGSDAEDDAAQEMMKGFLNTSQRLRGVEGCLLTTHPLPKEH